jgi:stalled ribosome alternative rescue factor ArfA
LLTYICPMKQKSKITISDNALDKVVINGLTRRQIIEKAMTGEGLVLSYEERMKRFSKDKK